MPSGKASKRLRAELMANQPVPKNQKAIITREEIHSEILAGPIPDPETLARYKIADSSFPERIMRMAEAHNEADVRAKNRITLSNLIIPVIGQIFTLMLGAGGILACIYLAMAGYTGGAIAAIVGGFSPLVINAFKGLRQGKK